MRVPGVTAYSESGSFTGYSYLRMRGLDQNRVSLSFDGIPLNDPEDQAFYFSNVPDFANSVQSVQVQRGTGTSAFGTASYAGSVNFQSLDLAAARRMGSGTIVTILPDRGDRYLSTTLFRSVCGRCPP